VTTFSAALTKALASDQVREGILKVGALPTSSTPDELRRHIAAEVARWQAVREKAGIEQQQ
jgi:tripartite-type tricarboxylate transporter receptor subunit TctC